MSNREMKKLPHNHIAEGEVTGHYHAAEGNGVTLFADDEGTVQIDAPEGATITHQTHHTKTVEPGQYICVGVQERDHVSEITRKVVD